MKINRYLLATMTLIFFEASLVSCGTAGDRTISKALMPFTVLKKAQIRFDGAPSYVVLVSTISPTARFKDTIKSIIGEIADSTETAKFNVDLYDDIKAADVVIETMYDKPRVRTKQENLLLGLHWVSSYTGGLTFEGKPAFNYEYELNIYPDIKQYEKSGAKADIQETLEFKPSF